MLMIDSIDFAEKIVGEILKKKQALMVANMSGSLDDHFQYKFNCGSFQGLTYVEEYVRNLVGQLTKPEADRSTKDAAKK